jgi:hypothetical protein
MTGKEGGRGEGGRERDGRRKGGGGREKGRYVQLLQHVHCRVCAAAQRDSPSAGAVRAAKNEPEPSSAARAE